ncbi:MAG: type III-B CRISPR module-associated protein Cmr5 [Acidobacteria bacterium]|nr:type III-B CRISPR module-associated protein Cmr5 [Acidobacteriota bacterium]
MGIETTNQPALSLDLERAKCALDRINSLRGKNYGNYVSYAEGLPAAILQNGLGQAMATLLAAAKGNKEDPHRLLYNHVADWLTRDHADAPYPKATDLMTAITSKGEDTYLRCQAEALAYLRWLKKFAVAFLKKAETTNAPALS